VEGLIDGSGTRERLVRVQNAAHELAEVVEDLVRDMETIALNLPARTKRTHELALATRARELARAVRAAVAETRNYGGLDRRRRVHREQERRADLGLLTTDERRATDRRQGDRRRPVAALSPPWRLGSYAAGETRALEGLVQGIVRD
jgi:hypothetical protein